MISQFRGLYAINIRHKHTFCDSLLEEVGPLSPHQRERDVILYTHYATDR